MTKDTQQLIPLETVTAVELFGGSDENKLNDLLAGIKSTAEKMAKGLAIDTEEGRKEIASVAYKVARSKTTIDEAGKDFVAGLKAQAKVVDERRRSVRNQLDTLRDEIRAPLNEWEAAEEARIEKHTDAISMMRQAGNDAFTFADDLGALTALRAKVEEVNPADFEEFEENATETRLAALAKIDTAIQQAKELEELRVLREEKAKREAEEARKAAEAAEAERQARIKADAEKAAQAAADKAIREAKEAEARANAQAEAAKKREAEALAQAEAAEKAAIERAERLQAEREAEERAEREARERNTRHKGACNSDAAHALVQYAGLNTTQARKVVEAIVKGKIPRVSLEY